MCESSWEYPKSFLINMSIWVKASPSEHSPAEHPEKTMTSLNLERIKYLVRLFGLSIQFYSKRAIDWAKSKLVAKRLASFAVVAAMLPVTVAPAAAPATSEVVEAAVSYNADIKLDTSKSTLLVSDTKISTIVPGESRVEKEAREAREKAEAEARAKALAEAREKATQSRSTVARERRVYVDPSNFDEIYARAGAAYGVDPRILSAIHQVETGRSGSSGITNHSGSGATGPMQFLPSTWRTHGVDGNGDGIKDINNVEDAIFAAAAYLKACGYPNVKKALWGYNPSQAYYNKVMRIAGM